jgi:phage host-nuclease inhibitor protein Gam
MTALLEKPLLPAFLLGNEPETTNDGFKICDEPSATWAANKVLAAGKRIEARQRMAEQLQTRVLDWLAEANKNDLASVAFLQSSLRPWVEAEVSKLGKVRSIRLLGAKVGLRKKPDRVEIFDTQSALDFCLEHLEDAVVVKKDVSKSLLKQHLLAGAKIPGAEMVLGEDELTVTSE